MGAHAAEHMIVNLLELFPVTLERQVGSAGASFQQYLYRCLNMPDAA